ncbi:hypothetical protein [uncultured Maricaulis sp.]|uniref:hypothetical protein n=1 Tax=uncultured Maricaulis sp. TaxID=174710 RepID=UPI0030DC1016|tara:strand:+ start:92173 stop:92661 length:489 start_codon:yes stop_codon:yes gene_type:complete
MAKTIQRFVLIILPLFVAVIFLDSLRYKFTDAPETQVIFGLLDGWAASWGAAGLFGHTGLFSQYVIGSAELIASTSLLIGFIPELRRLQVIGAALGLAVMTGAISFHLFTPLGIDPNQDGGGLFMAACGVWLSCIVLLALKRQEALAIGCGLIRLLIQTPAR